MMQTHVRSNNHACIASHIKKNHTYFVIIVYYTPIRFGERTLSMHDDDAVNKNNI